MLFEKIDHATFKGNAFFTFCNEHLCFNYLWPGYYYNQENIKKEAQVYNIGSILLDLQNHPERINNYLKGKIICIGNFTDDLHETPNGTIPGTIILSDIYLSLLNGEHFVPYLWILLLIISFSTLSYISFYKKMPEIKLNLPFFSAHLSGFIKQYFSYMGILLILSFLSVLLFGINVSLFFPAFIFSGIEYVKEKKYKN
jgi:hypothetical protein